MHSYRRAVIGLLLKPGHCAAMLAMAECTNVAIRPVVTGHLTENGGDGGGHIPSALTCPYHVRLPNPESTEGMRF